MSITIGSGITLGAGITLLVPPAPWTWDPAYVGGPGIDLTNANLVAVANSSMSGEPSVLGTWYIPVGSKVMFSVCALAVTTSDVSGIGVGSRAMNVNDYIGVDFATSQGVYEDGGNYTQTQTPENTGLTFVSLDTIDVAVDRLNNLFWYRITGFTGTGNWNNDVAADPATATGGYPISDLVGTVYPAAGPFYVAEQNPPTGAFGANSEPGGAVPNGFTFAAAVAPTWTWNQLGSGLQTVFSGRTVFDLLPGTYTALGSYAIADTDRVMYSVILDYDADMMLTQNQAVGFGLASTNLEAGLGADQYSMGVYNNGDVIFNGTLIAGLSNTFGQGDVIDVAIVGTYIGAGWWYRVNGGPWNDDPTADPATNIGGFPQYVNDTGLPLYPGVSIAGDTGPSVFTMQEAPIYPKPAGFTFLGSSQIAPPSLVTAGMLLNFDAKTYSGTGNWIDSWAGVNAVPSNSPVWSADNGGTFVLDATSVQYFTVPWPTFQPTFTIDIWFNFTGEQPGSACLISDDFSGPFNFTINAAGNQLQTGWYPTNWQGQYATNNVPTVLTHDGSTWYNITMAVGASEYKDYINGVVSYAPGNFGGAAPAGSGSLQQFYIGKRWDLTDTVNAKMAVVNIYDRALTDVEVTQNFNYYKSRFGL